MKRQYVERRGGKRLGSGRKKLSEQTYSYTVHLTPDHASLLKRWGNGNVSAGLRWLIDAASVLVRHRRPD